MIRHIVMWKFRPGTEAEQERFLAGLQGLQGVIPQLRRSEVARSVGADNYDAVLVSEFDTLADLELYAYSIESVGAFLPPLLLSRYTGRHGTSGGFSKWFFYMFYPLHLLVLGWLQAVL